MMEKTSHMVGEIMARSDFIHKILPYRPDILGFQPANFSAMIGYDFHITPTGPKLIEINTNAGGLMTSALWRLRDTPIQAGQVIHRMVNMFRIEYSNWSGGKNDNIHHIAIVDRDPDTEFTIDDFRLTGIAFETYGIEVSICRTDQLTLRGNRVYTPGHHLPVDIIYNRSCDFYLEEQYNKTLLHAYINHAACVTPNPYGYGILSDKRSLALLHRWVISEDGFLTPDERRILSPIILPTHLLADDFEHFTSEKSKWFFKHINLHGGQGAFRGNKLSRKKLSELLPAEYIVQEIAKPDELPIKGNKYKYDIRLFTHQNITLDISCRLYEGRLTNFRTQDGGYTKIEFID